MSKEKVEEFVSAHLEASSISIIDDIINAVNDIMYKCTEGMEQYLSNRQRQILGKQEEVRKEKERNKLEKLEAKKAEIELKTKEREEEDDEVIIQDEEDEDNKEGNDTTEPSSLFDTSESNVTLEDISIGSAKLESLLEHAVDKNFDRFELYTLRNIFNVPSDLVEEGWIRLQEHKNIVISPNDVSKSKELDDEYIELITQMKQEIMLNQLLNKLMGRSKRIAKFLLELKQELEFLDVKPVGDTIDSGLKTKIKGLHPLSETLQFLVGQVADLYDQVNELRLKINVENSITSDSSDEDNDDKEEEVGKSSKDKYVDALVSRAFRVTKVRQQQKDSESEKEDNEDEGEKAFSKFVTSGKKGSKRRRIYGKYEDISNLGSLLDKEY